MITIITKDGGNTNITDHLSLITRDQTKHFSDKDFNGINVMLAEIMKKYDVDLVINGKRLEDFKH
jgi:electron transfer flavoprotein alpha/beta subunit